jgi:hypothetical protein
MSAGKTSQRRTDRIFIKRQLLAKFDGGGGVVKSETLNMHGWPLLKMNVSTLVSKDNMRQIVL